MNIYRKFVLSAFLFVGCATLQPEKSPISFSPPSQITQETPSVEHLVSFYANHIRGLYSVLQRGPTIVNSLEITQLDQNDPNYQEKKALCNEYRSQMLANLDQVIYKLSDLEQGLEAQNPQLQLDPTYQRMRRDVQLELPQKLEPMRRAVNQLCE